MVDLLAELRHLEEREMAELLPLQAAILTTSMLTNDRSLHQLH